MSLAFTNSIRQNSYDGRCVSKILLSVNEYHFNNAALFNLAYSVNCQKYLLHSKNSFTINKIKIARGLRTPALDPTEGLNL